MGPGHQSLSWGVWENKTEGVHNEGEERVDSCVFDLAIKFTQQTAGPLLSGCVCEVCVAWKEWVMPCHRRTQSDNGSVEDCVTPCPALWRYVFIYCRWVRLCNCLHQAGLLFKWVIFPSVSLKFSSLGKLHWRRLLSCKQWPLCTLINKTIYLNLWVQSITCNCTVLFW